MVRLRRVGLGIVIALLVGLFALAFVSLFANIFPAGAGLTLVFVLLLAVYLEARWLNHWLGVPLAHTLWWALTAEVAALLIRSLLWAWPEYLFINAVREFQLNYSTAGFDALDQLVLQLPWLWLAGCALVIIIKAPMYYVVLVRGWPGRPAWPALTAPLLSYSIIFGLVFLLAVVFAQFQDPSYAI